jgi:ATP-dependent DNA helicase UvrD/PcrA
MMILRTAKSNGKNFWGCSKFPRCKGVSWINTYEKKVIEKIALPNNVIGTPQQESIWSAATNTQSHLIIDALAGSGKTFTIVHFLRYITGKIVFVAFNRHIVDELIARVPDGIEVKTMNGFGYAQVRAWNPNIKFNEDKLYDILETIIPQDEDTTAFYTDAVYKLVNLCKYNLLDGKNHNDLDNLTLKHGIELNDSRDEIYGYVESAIRMSKDGKITAKTAKGKVYTRYMRDEVDFNDQLWFVYVHNINVAQYDYMLGDEIQDWNPLQQYVAMRAIAKNGRFVGVGDQNQAIYAFSGADTQSIPNMTVMLENTARNVEIKQLTFTRRCPKSHVVLAQQIVPSLEALPDAKEGTVNYINRDSMIATIVAGNMGICRRNAPLIAIAYELIRNGKSVIVRGRDIGKSLQSLISKFHADSIDELLDKADEYRIKETIKLQKKGKKAENAIQALNDKIDTLIALCDGKYTINDVRRSIETLFSDNNPHNSIILSSVHRSKGLEADTVFVIEYDRIRIPMADEEFAQQEANLEYISLTRSKDTLNLVIG